jgi:hypothetical protein
MWSCRCDQPFVAFVETGSVAYGIVKDRVAAGGTSEFEGEQHPGAEH